MKKKCAWCSTEFEAEKPNADTCGPKCRVAAWRAEKKKAGEPGKPPKEANPAEGHPEAGKPVEPPPAAKDAPAAAPEPKPATVAPEAQVIRRLPMKGPKGKVRIWPAGMKAEEVRERLYRIRDYNATMRRQGTPQHGATEAQVRERLAEVGADMKLLKIAFP